MTAGSESSLLKSMLLGDAWGPTLGGPTPVTFSFMTAAPAEDMITGFQQISAGDQAIVMAAMKTYSDIANISFTQLAPGATADIMFGESAQNPSSGLTYQRSGSSAAVAPGFASFDSAHIYFNDSTHDDPVNFWLTLHEMGNATGLNDFSQLSFDDDMKYYGLSGTYANFDYTVMANNWPNHGSYQTSSTSNAVPASPLSATPQMLDVLALQFLYGANQTGYTTQSATMTSAGLHYSFTTANLTECIWVGDQVSGVATFDFSSCGGPIDIDLTAGSFSATGFTSTRITSPLAGTPFNNISIAYGAVIGVGIGNNGGDSLTADSAAGHNDVMVGGTGNDSFTAGGGTDLFIGAGGTDTAIFHDKQSDYTVTQAGPAVLVITDHAAAPADGQIVLYGAFSTLQFSDGAVSIAAAAAQTAFVSAPAADIQANLDNLESLVAGGQVTSIGLTDAGVPALSVSAAQFSADAAALADITNPYFLLTVAAGPAPVTLTGLAGHGTIVQFAGTAGSFTIAATGSGQVTVGSDVLNDISAVQFTDQTIIVAAAPGGDKITTGNLTELYAAVFGREPDVGGLNYYQQILRADPSTPLLSFALSFLASPEYTGNPMHDYAQTAAGDAQFIKDSYNNLLHRDPAAGDVDWYMANIVDPILAGAAAGTAAYTQAEALAHAHLLVDFSASAEFLGNVQITAAHPASAQHWLLLS